MIEAAIALLAAYGIRQLMIKWNCHRGMHRIVHKTDIAGPGKCKDCGINTPPIEWPRN